MKKIRKNNYVENIKKIKPIKKYEEICRYYIGFGTLITIWTLGLEKIPISLPLYGSWDLEKFHARASSRALGLGKMSSSASI